MSALEVSMMKRIGELNAEIKLRKAELTDCKATADRLKAEVERLRKAGDAVCESPYVWETDPAVIEWRAAKEGKSV